MSIIITIPISLKTGIFNIVSGGVAEKSFNIDQSVELRFMIMSDFLKSWPEGFKKTVSKPIVTMSVDKNTSIQISIYQFIEHLDTDTFIGDILLLDFTFSKISITKSHIKQLWRSLNKASMTIRKVFR